MTKRIARRNWAIVTVVAGGLAIAGAENKAFVLPPISDLAPQKRAAEVRPQPEKETENAEPPQRLAIELDQIDIRGATVFSPETLLQNSGLSELHGRTVTAEDLESIRLALTQQYVNQGYVNSGALLPDQDASDGQIQFQIVEGRLKTDPRRQQPLAP